MRVVFCVDTFLNLNLSLLLQVCVCVYVRVCKGVLVSVGACIYSACVYVCVRVQA